jgi:NO-binding membrane sensor protein with MHYT domain
MVHVSHFTYGWINPALGFGMSFIGSLLGLHCVARGRESRGALGQVGWIALASVSIGGTGIWLAHFLMMLGFTVPDGPVKYDPMLTVVSAVVAVVVVGAGLAIAGPDRLDPRRLLAGGLFTGLGIAAMHYVGMAALHVRGTLHYELAGVIASVLIAVAAATAALWFAVAARTGVTMGLAGATMAAAVLGMHYVGMTAVQVEASKDPDSAVAGTDPSGFLATVTIYAAFAVMTVLYFVLTAPDELERATTLGMRELIARAARGLTAEPPAAPEVPAQPLGERAGSHVAAEADPEEISGGRPSPRATHAAAGSRRSA